MSILRSVYLNLIKVAEYREITLDAPTLSEQNFAKQMMQFEHVLITGKRSGKTPRPDVKFYCVLIKPMSDFESKSAEIEKIFKSIGLDRKKEAPEGNYEIMYVVSAAIPSAVGKLIDSYASPRVYINVSPFYMFYVETPVVYGVPTHELLTTDEFNKICLQNFALAEGFPKILNDDPMAVWLGIRPRMGIRILRASATCGEAVSYRYCVKNYNGKNTSEI